MSMLQPDVLDFIFTEDDRNFRQEVRNFIDRSLPDALRHKMIDRHELDRSDIRNWQRTLNSNGWATPSWPTSYGGPGWSPLQRYIFLDELYRAPAPEPLTFNVNLIGPLLIAFGSEEQKARFLPRIANLDDWWCQGFSEPNAGSDLASLRTTAKREGDHYVVRGQKIWTTLGHFADWMICLVRTENTPRKQEGISILMIDMTSPGITVQPIVYLDGRHESNQVFFDDVKVPAENLIGEEGKGWTYAKYLLGHERVGIARLGTTKQRIERIKALASQSEMQRTSDLLPSARFRERVTALEVELLALEMTQLRVLSDHASAGNGGYDAASSILKIKGSELQQSAAALLFEMAGLRGLTKSAEDGVELESWERCAASNYFFSRAFSIYGGSNEIQKNIVAKSVLGL